MVQNYRPAGCVKRGGILTFEVKRPNALGVAVELSEKSNIMIRDGALCVHPILIRSSIAVDPPFIAR